MDNRQKLSGPYIPDQGTQREVVVIGINGSIKSLVAASLLKIQKYDLIAVTVLNSWEETDAKVLSCHISEPSKDKISDFCRHLGIPHHFVKTGPAFREEVVEKWVSAKITGSLPSTCQSCHSLRMRTLFAKMKEIGASKLATGHLAKVFHQDSAGADFIRTSNDEQFDESAQLAALPGDILETLLLPLSDLQNKEVMKLAENFQLVGSDAGSKVTCFPEMPELTDYLEKHVPPKFIASGEVASLDDERFDEHEGVHRLSYGKAVSIEEAKNENVFVEYSFAKKKVLVGHRDVFVKQKFLLIDCQLSPESSWIEPLRAFLKTNSAEGECWVSLRSLNACYVECDLPLKVLENEFVTITKKKGKNAKIYLTGMVRYLPEKKTNDEGEENAKTDNSADW